MLPQRNATLLRIERSGGTTETGFSDDYDRAATDTDAGDAGEDLLVGRAAAYVIERRISAKQGEEAHRIMQRTVLLDQRVAIHEGDTLTVEHAGAEKTGVVEVVEDHFLPGVARQTRVTLKAGG